MEQTTPETPDDEPQVVSGILDFSDRHRNVLKTAFSVVLIIGMVYGILVWAEVVPYLF